jgi:hypothetical protein
LVKEVLEEYRMPMEVLVILTQVLMAVEEEVELIIGAVVEAVAEVQ